MQEGQEAAAETSTICVEEVAIVPVVLEVDGRCKVEFSGLSEAVVVPGAGKFSDDGDVEGGGLSFERFVLGDVGEFAGFGGMRNKLGEGCR